MEKLKKHEEEEGRRKDNFLQDGYIVEPTDHGLMLYTLKDIPIGESLYLFKEFSYGEAMLLTSLVRPGMTVIDVGANFGCMTLPLARKVGRQEGWVR